MRSWPGWHWASEDAVLSLARLRPAYRMLYTGVLLFMTAGTTAHTVHQWLKGGIAPGRIAAWYRGNEGDAAAGSILFPRGLEEVVNDAWTALFTCTLALVIFGAILHRASRERAAAALVGGYAAAALVTAASPVLVRYVSPDLALLDSGALVALPVLAVAMTALALREMWADEEEMSGDLL